MLLFLKDFEAKNLIQEEFIFTYKNIIMQLKNSLLSSIYVTKSKHSEVPLIFFLKFTTIIQK